MSPQASPTDSGAAPLLSICIPTFNRAEFIGIAIDSVLQEAAGPSIEIVVCDNASSDGTEDLIRQLSVANPYIRYVRNERNIGADRNVLRLIDESRGRYCWILGSDDALMPGALAHVLAAIATGADLIMGDAEDCDLQLQKTGVLKFLAMAEARLDFGQREDILRFLDAATMSASLFGYLSSMIFRRAAWMAIPVTRHYTGSAYPQVSRGLDILVKGRGSFHYLACPIAKNRRNNCSHEAAFGRTERVLTDFRLFRRTIDDYFSTDLELRNHFKEYVRRCHSNLMRGGVRTGHDVADRHIAFFEQDDSTLPVISWQWRPKVAAALSRWQGLALFDQLFAVDAMLHLGYRGGSQEPNLPVNERAIGVEFGYSGYDGIHLPFESASQDTIWASFCLHHISDPATALRDWLRVLKPGGNLLISSQLVSSQPRAAASPHSGLELSHLFSLLGEAMTGGDYRIAHCSQSEPGGDTAPIIDLVLTKLAPAHGASVIKTTPTATVVMLTTSEGQRVLSLAEAVQLAVAKYQAGEVALSEQIFRTVTSADSDNFVALQMLGVICFQQGDLDQALAFTQRAADIQPGNAEVHGNLGVIHLARSAPA